MYTLLINVKLNTRLSFYLLVWNKMVHLKVFVFAQSLFLNYLSIKDKLILRGCVHFDSPMCIAGYESDKLFCTILLIVPFLGLFEEIFLNGWGFSGTMHCKVEAHAHKFGGLDWRGKMICDKFGSCDWHMCELVEMLTFQLFISL